MLPFLTLPGLSYRFFYVAQIGLLLVLTSTISGLLASRRPMKTLMGLALLVISVLIPARHLDTFTRDWVSSGAVTHSLATQIHQLYPLQPPGMNFYVFGAPVTYSSVPMFISYFDSSVRFMYDGYRAFRGVVLNSWELGSKLHLVNSLRGQVVHTRAPCPSSEVLFDKSSLRVVETTKERWLELVKAHPGMTFLP